MPLYLEMICNQFPEAQRALVRIIYYCRYKVHAGFTLSADDYETIMQIEPFNQPLKTITSQSAELYQLNKAIGDLAAVTTETENIAYEHKVALGQPGTIDPKKVFRERMHAALGSLQASLTSIW